VFDLGTILTLYPPPRPSAKAPAPRRAPCKAPRQADVSTVSAAPATVLTCPVRPGATPGRSRTEDTENTTTATPPPGGTDTRSEER
jgi:hypothetical protein